MIAPLLRTAGAVVAGTLLLTGASLPIKGSASSPPEEGAASGARFTYRVTSSSSEKSARERRSMLTTVQMQNGSIRMDYVEGATPLGQQNGYVIVNGDPVRFIVVDPKEKKAMIMNGDAFGSGLGGLLNNPMLKMTFSDVTFRYKDMGAGGSILGHATRRVRTWSTSTMELKAMMMPDQKVISSDSSDVWIATGLEIRMEDMEQWAKSFSSRLRSSSPQADAEIGKYMREFGRSGLVMRSVTWSTDTDKKGKVTTDSITTEITDLTIGAIDPSVFEIPKGYEVVDLADVMAKTMASEDSAGASEDKGSAGDAIKKGIGGLLKKKK